MTDALPEPLVPAGADLRDFPFMPLEVQRLRRSKAWLICKRNPALAFYMVNLWTACWHDVPAGSLEDDDDVLADLAMCEPAKWAKVREQVLRGWVKSDGRLYHPVVAEKVREAWAAKLAQRHRTEAARHAREQKRLQQQQQDQSSVTTVAVTESVTEVVTESKREGQGERQGQGDSVSSSSAKASEAAAPDPVKDEIWRTGRGLLERAGDTRDNAGKFLGKLCKDYGQKLVLDAVRDAVKTTPAEPKAWLSARCQERRAAAPNKAEAQAARNHAVVDRMLGGSDA